MFAEIEIFIIFLALIVSIFVYIIIIQREEIKEIKKLLKAEKRKNMEMRKNNSFQEYQFREIEDYLEKLKYISEVKERLDE